MPVLVSERRPSRARFKTAVENAEEAASVFKMVDNYPRRLAAVIKAEGGPTKY